MTDLAKEGRLQARRVMIRVDMNVPMRDGKPADTQRIAAHLATIKGALDAGAAKVILLSHLGRPKEGQFDAQFSLQGVAQALSEMMAMEVPLVSDYLSAELPDVPLALCENIRFHEGEKADDAELAKQLAQCCDVFVMDAFACAHRIHASTHGVAQYSETACAGPLLLDEVENLRPILTDLKARKARYSEDAQDLYIAIVGGSKVSSKIGLLEFFAGKADVLIIGGGIANTFLAAQGHPVGKSLYEQDSIPFVQQYQEQAKQSGTHLVLPDDVVCGKSLMDEDVINIEDINAVPDGLMILDFGTAAMDKVAALIQKAGTVLWNGPLGVFENPGCTTGTEKLAQAIAHSKARCVAGGGDTLHAIKTFKTRDGEAIDKTILAKGGYISTGGGSFIEFIQGKMLPGIEVLEKRAA